MKIMIPSEKAKILDENIEFNKENNSLVIGNNLEVDGNLQLNGNIIVDDNPLSFSKQFYEVDWHNNGIYPKKEIKGLLLSLNKVLIDVNTGLVLELVKYSDNEIKLMTKENIYDDTTCYINEYIFKTIVGDEENYSLTIHDDLSISVEHP